MGRLHGYSTQTSDPREARTARAYEPVDPTELPSSRASNRHHPGAGLISIYHCRQPGQEASSHATNPKMGARPGLAPLTNRESRFPSSMSCQSGSTRKSRICGHLRSISSMINIFWSTPRGTKTATCEWPRPLPAVSVSPGETWAPLLNLSTVRSMLRCLTTMKRGSTSSCTSSTTTAPSLKK